MNNNERIKKLKQSFKTDSKEKVSPSSSSSSFNSVGSLNQSILFFAKGKFYRESFGNLMKCGNGECEIIENNQSGNKFYVI